MLGTEHETALINIPKKHVYYLNIYDTYASLFSTREMADNLAVYGRLACVRVEAKEGQSDA